MSTINSLNRLRRKIDKIDSGIVKLLNDRNELSHEIGNIKKSTSTSVYSPSREQEVLAKVKKANKGPLRNEALEAIYREIMSSNIQTQKEIKVAYLGPAATFSHQAAIKKFASLTKYIPCESIKDVFLEVEKDSADFGVVPIENSIEGSISYTLDMFVDSDLKICSQILLNISHNLLSKYPKNKIKRIYSNPQVFGQCRRWIENNLTQVELIDVSSTTRAAQIASKEKNSACIGSLLAARVYGLKIVAKSVEDSPHNITRFLVIGKTQALPTRNDKTSIMFSIKDSVGALHDMLVPFKKYKINLTKIESRPSKRKTWDYYFFVDLNGHIYEKKVRTALNELEDKCKFLKVLGSYPAGD